MTPVQQLLQDLTLFYWTAGYGEDAKDMAQLNVSVACLVSLHREAFDDTDVELMCAQLSHRSAQGRAAVIA